MSATFTTLTPADCDRLLRQARHRRRFRQTLSTFARAFRASSVISCQNTNSATNGKPDEVGPQKRSSGGSFEPSSLEGQP